MIHNHDHNFVNLCILLKTGGEPEKPLELQTNEVLVKCRFLGYRFFRGVWGRNGLVEIVTGKLISREWKFSLSFVTKYYFFFFGVKEIKNNSNEVEWILINIYENLAFI